MFGTIYRIGEKPGSLEYAMNPGDLRDNLRSIRNGKEFSRFHDRDDPCASGRRSAPQQFLFEDHTPAFLVNLAHDVQLTTAPTLLSAMDPHIIRGIEIYKGKPIFYDLGEFFREWDWSLRL